MALLDNVSLIRFQDYYFERVWGGRKLQSLYRKNLPADVPIGEDWLITDHAAHESVVTEGPLAGRTLRQLVENDPENLLGTQPQLTRHGRFPLLLKLLDAADVLSVQVHPDDICAEKLKESDIGKTEMWYVLHAEPRSQLICGLHPGVSEEQLLQACGDARLDTVLSVFEVHAGSAVFVPAGTVHAIGAGVILAEIQQNSDLTYRLYDWGRVSDDRKSRPLHLDKAAKAIHWSRPHPGPAKPLLLERHRRDPSRMILAACRHFAAELVRISGFETRETQQRSFHIVLCAHGSVALSAGADTLHLNPGEAGFVTGRTQQYTIEGEGSLLDYYVPELGRDIVGPLLESGYPLEEIRQLPDLGDISGLAS
ncbi:MAG: class I mannose-6-phosphate isomerase [Candidatus Hydrogenedentes bacterium]|nr:class I mannose-6-phosphate isomerase [Candidatus Hydrogenedentota bacterium]